MKNIKIDPEKIFIRSIKTLKGNIDSLDVLPTEYSFQFETNTAVAREKKLIRLVLDVEIRDAVAKNSSNVASYSHEFVFYIQNFDDYVDWDEEKSTVNINANLGRTLASIAYSTVRGIILIRTQGTALNGIILPVVDPAKLLQDCGG